MAVPTLGWGAKGYWTEPPFWGIEEAMTVGVGGAATEVVSYHSSWSPAALSWYLRCRVTVATEYFGTTSMDAWPERLARVSVRVIW